MNGEHSKKEDIDSLSEEELAQIPNYNDEPDTIPGRCDCGNPKFDLSYINHKLLRKCKKCGKAKFI